MHASSDDAVLLEHLQLANQQLRAVLAGAGCPLPELPLPADLRQLQEEEAMALLAEENYQLRQLLQQLQHQQQLQELEQQLLLQQELEESRSALCLDRLSPSPQPHQQQEQPQQQQQLPPGGQLSTDAGDLLVTCSPAAAVLDSTGGWASPARASTGGVLSPMAARLVATPPSLNTVQLVEAEAAAQLATQAVIQAEAQAHQHMSWQMQPPLQHEQPSSYQAQQHGQGAAGPSDDDYVSSSRGELCQQGDHAASNRPLPAPSQGQQQGLNQADTPWQGQQQPAAQASNTRLALPQLPRLTLPRAVTGRQSQDSVSSEAGRSSLCSGASSSELGSAWAPHTAGGPSQQPPSAAAASARSNASSSCGGLKQLTNDLLLLPPALRAAAAATGPDASQETFGGRAAAAAEALGGDYENGARGFGLGLAGAAAGMAADAAAGIWYPAPAGVAAEGSSAAAGVGASEQQSGCMSSPGSRAADVATHAVKGIMYPSGVMLRGQDGSAAAASRQPQLRLPQSVFAGATQAAAAAAMDSGDAAGTQQWQQELSFAQQQQQHLAQVQQQQQHLAQVQQQQQQQQPLVQVQAPSLPPIATTSRQAGSGAGLHPHAHLQSAAAPVSQAAAAAAALAGQCFQQQPQQPQQQQQRLPALRLPSRVQTFQQQQQHQRQELQQQQQQQVRLPTSWSDDCPPSAVPASLPKLRLPGQRQPTAAAASSGAAGLARLQVLPAAPAPSCSSSPEESPCSDSGFFRAADAGLFDGGSNGLFDAGADMFGARISMDDSGRRLSYGEAQPSQLPEVPEDYFGLPDSTEGSGDAGSCFGASQQSGWLGVSYQHSLRAAQGFGGLGSGSVGSREHSALLSAAASAEDGSYGGFRRRRGLGPGATDTIDELAEWGDEPLSRQDTRGSAWSGSGFMATAGAAGSMSSITSGALSQQVSFQGGIAAQHSSGAAHTAAAVNGAHQQVQEPPAFPNLAPLRVCTGRQQQDQTPPLMWQPQALRTDSSSSVHSGLGRMPSSATAAAAVAAAASPAHMAAAEAAEEAASVGLAAAASGGMDSLQLQQLLTHLARVAEEASSSATAAATGKLGQPAARTPAARAGPPAAVHTAAGDVRAADSPHSAAASRHAEQQQGMQQYSAGQQQQQQGAQPPPQQQHLQDAAAADCFTPVARAGGCDQQGTPRAPGSATGPKSLSPFATTGLNSPARGAAAAAAAAGCLVLSPRPSLPLQRTLSAGQMAPVLGLPPKWASRSGSSSNLTALHTQHSQASPRRQQQQALLAAADDTAGQAQDQHGRGVPCAAAAAALGERAATVPAPAPAGSLVSPRLGLHGRLRVITHVAAVAGGGYSSNGSNSDAEAGSAHTTPMHRPPAGAGVLRTNSGSSFRPAGLASITVPPSPASSGVRYVPASPRVVGFDCPLTPHAYALRSPSWRSEAGGEAGSMGCSHAPACCSAGSTPRRQASSPGLLQQALSRSGLAPQQHHSQPQLGHHSGSGSAAGSGCTTPSSAASAARRAASASGGLCAAQPLLVGAGADRLHDGSHGGSSSSCGLKQVGGSCSSNALLLTMMGGHQLPVVHHQRTASSPYLDTVQSPGSAHRLRFSASGLDAAAAEVAASRAAAQLGAAANGAGGAAAAAAAQQVTCSNASSRRSSSDSGCRLSPQHRGVPAAAAAPLESGPEAAVAVAPAAQADAASHAAIDAVLQLPRSVSPQLAGPRSRSVSPSLQQQHQQVTSPPAADAGQHRLSRFGLAAARASSEKPLAGCSSKGGDAAGALPLPAHGLTAVVMTVGQAASGSCSSGGVAGSSEAGHLHTQGSALAAAGAAGAAGQGAAAAGTVAVPDTPALDEAASGAAFAGQHSLEQELQAVGEGASLAGDLVEQELLRASAEASQAAAAATSCSPPSAASDEPTGLQAGCSSGGGGSGEAGSSSSSGGSRQRVTWAGDDNPSAGPACSGGCGQPAGCEGCAHHHVPPASPCTPQQEAGQQQQQQQLPSPDRQQQHQHTWQEAQAGPAKRLAQQQQHQPAVAGCSGSPGGSRPLLPRSKSAAAYLAGSTSAAAAVRAASDAGTPTAAAGEGAGAAPGMWSPTHDVRGSSGRHRSPSALLMRLSQRQVEVLMARGRASSTVPYVLPHRSSNPASALRALSSTGSGDCSSSGQHSTDLPAAGAVAAAVAAAASAGAPAGSTPRASMDLGSSSSSPHAQQALQSEPSWDVEQLAPPQDLFAVATAAAADTERVYIPLPRAESAAAAAEAQQQRQHQQEQELLQQQGSAELVGAASGATDTREVLQSAAIVQQRLNNTSKWLGPAPVVASSAAAAEAEAAAVVTRRRSGQHEPADLGRSSSSDAVGRGGSRGSSGRVAMAAAALVAGPAVAADTADSVPRANSGGSGTWVAMQAAALAAPGDRGTAAGLRRTSSSGGSGARVAAAAAALAAFSAAAGAEPGLNAGRVAAKLRPGDAWLAAAGGEVDSAGPARKARSGPATSEACQPQQQQEEVQEPTQLAELQSTAGAAAADAPAESELAGVSSGSEAACQQEQQEPRQQGSGLQTAADKATAAEASSGCPVFESHITAADAMPAQPAASTSQQEEEPGCAGAGSSSEAAAAVAAEPAAATGQGSSPAQELQELGQAWSGAGEDPAVRIRQQQLLKQRQVLRAQQQAKRQEVAAWALAQQQVQLEQAAPALAASTDGTNAPAAGCRAAAAVTAAGALDAAGSGPDQAPAGPPADAAPEAAAGDAACCSDALQGLAAASDSSLPVPDAAAAAPAALTDAAVGSGGFESLGLGLQRCDSLAPSVADSFEVQSWAAWSTTSSISRCPKLQWWGNDAGQGRFSQRQQRRLQQQQQRLAGAGGDGAQAAWWKRLLQASREEGSRAGAQAAAPSHGVQQ